MNGTQQSAEITILFEGLVVYIQTNFVLNNFIENKCT
jgi:hypothetical protein